MCNCDTGIAIFNPETMTFRVITPRGEFTNVRSVGGFDNYREMDEYVGSHYVCEECKKNGLMAYLFGSLENLYLFYYPDIVGGGDIGVYRVDDETKGTE